eukprot:Em0110g17a
MESAMLLVTASSDAFKAVQAHAKLEVASSEFLHAVIALTLFGSGDVNAVALSLWACSGVVAAVAVEVSRLGRKTTEASPNYVVKKRDSEDTIAPLATSSSSSDPPLLEGELLNYTAPDITYLDHFEGAQIGTLYITDYKLYFKLKVPVGP